MAIFHSFFDPAFHFVEKIKLFLILPLFLRKAIYNPREVRYTKRT